MEESKGELIMDEAAKQILEKKRKKSKNKALKVTRI